jgi:hypothetical protein
MKGGKIIAVVALVAVIGVAAYYTIFGGGGGGSTPEIPADKVRSFLCVSKACGAAFGEADINQDDAGPYGDAGAMAIKCPKCGQFSVFATRKCPCGESYVPTLSYLGPQGGLKCPKCGKAPE